MAAGWIHTEYRSGRWINEVEGGEVLDSHPTQTRAVEAGRAEAKQRQTEHLIHRIDGTVAARNSYRDRSFPPRGR